MVSSRNCQLYGQCRGGRLSGGLTFRTSCATVRAISPAEVGETPNKTSEQPIGLGGGCSTASENLVTIKSGHDEEDQVIAPGGNLLTVKSTEVRKTTRRTGISREHESIT